MLRLRTEPFPWAPRVSESQGASGSDGATGPSRWRPRQAGASEHPSAGQGLAWQSTCQRPSATGWDPASACRAAGSPAAGPAPLPRPDGAGVSGAARGVSSGDSLLLRCFTRVLEINLTLISPTGEKLIEVLFFIYEKASRDLHLMPQKWEGLPTVYPRDSADFRGSQGDGRRVISAARGRTEIPLGH